jgi:hypothetical protein
MSDQGRHSEAHERLLAVCGAFEAGSGTADLSDAKTLLEGRITRDPSRETLRLGKSAHRSEKYTSSGGSGTR